MTTTVVYSTEGGHISSNGAFAVALAGTGSIFPDTPTLTWVGIWGAVDQGYEAFDTSVVPDADTVTAAVLDIWVNDPPPQNFTPQVRLFDWGGGTVTTADWRTPTDLASCTLLATANGSALGSGTYASFTDVAFAANVNKTGWTRVVLVSEENVTSTEVTQRQLRYNAASSTHPPRLTITHDHAAASTATAEVATATAASGDASASASYPVSPTGSFLTIHMSTISGTIDPIAGLAGSTGTVGQAHVDIIARPSVISAVATSYNAGVASAGGLLAFPGAQGWGASTTGGRGGTIYVVTHGGNSGAGSLRAAMEATGPRYIVFKYAGDITLTALLAAESGNLTIAGQTSPGSGVCVRGNTMAFGSSNNNSIMRGMRVRNGTFSSPSEDNFSIFGPSSSSTITGFAIDHCSFSWGRDEDLGISANIRNASVSYCIVSEGLPSGAETGKGIHFGGTGSTGGVPRQISLYRTVMAHNPQRNPRVQGTGLEMVNCIAYNWGTRALQISEGETAGLNEPRLNIINDWFKVGANSNTGGHIRMGHLGTGPAWTPNAPMVYMSGNITPSRTTQAASEWSAMGTADQAANLQYQSLSPFSQSAYPITVLPIGTGPTLLSAITSGVGASLSRDAVDTRIMNDVTNGTGATVTSPGTYPTLSGTAWTDTIVTGMDDAWVTAHGVTSATQVMPSGYPAIEEWINSFYP